MTFFKFLPLLVLLVCAISESEGVLRAKRQFGWSNPWAQVNTEREVINRPFQREVITDTQRRGWNGGVVDTEREVIRRPGFTEVITETQRQPGWGGGWGK